MPAVSVTRRLMIEGRVQGVGCRAALADQATLLGVIGWVRNRRSGAVEALLRGDPDQVQALTDWARIGPPSALVTAVQVTEESDAVHVSAGFFIAGTE